VQDTAPNGPKHITNIFNAKIEAFPANITCQATISGLNLLPPQAGLAGSDWQLQIALMDGLGAPTIVLAQDDLYPSFVGMHKDDLSGAICSPQGQAYLRQQMATLFPLFDHRQGTFGLLVVGPIPQYGVQGPIFLTGFTMDQTPPPTTTRKAPPQAAKRQDKGRNRGQQQQQHYVPRSGPRS